MKRVFIADNHINYSSSLEALLRSLSFDVFVDHGHHGPEYIFKEIQVTTPDIIISDIIFPNFDGLVLVHSLAEHIDTLHIPLAVYTSGNNRWLMSKSFDQGADHFFIKEDFPPHILIDRLLKIYEGERGIANKL